MGKESMYPWLEIQGMKEKMDQLMDDVRERFDLDQRVLEKGPLWQPITDAYETDQAFIIQLELPGLEREQIRLEIKNNELRVCGERRMVKDVSGSSYQIMERSYGPFARRFVLPKAVDAESIQASLSNGLLNITIPKKHSAGGMRKIEINADTELP
jgi:HSP20 family protein